MSQQVEKIKQKLSSAQLKTTTARVALLQAIEHFTEPFTIENVLLYLKQKNAAIHRATVYRDTQSFVEHGLLRELGIRGSAAHYYENPTPTVHYHFICTTCLSIKTLTDPKLEAALHVYEKSLSKQGKVVLDRGVKFYGTCTQCLTV